MIRHTTSGFDQRGNKRHNQIRTYTWSTLSHAILCGFMCMGHIASRFTRLILSRSYIYDVMNKKYHAINGRPLGQRDECTHARRRTSAAAERCPSGPARAPASSTCAGSAPSSARSTRSA